EAGLPNDCLKTLRSALLTTKVPSRPSTFANHIPSGVWLPIVSLRSALSSGEVVKVKTSVGLSKPWLGLLAPTQRTARSAASELRRASTLLESIAPLPLIHFQSFGPCRTTLSSSLITRENR